MKNYIVINGRKAELTEEQLKALGIKEEKKNNVFNRAKEYGTYYRINPVGEVIGDTENKTPHDNHLYNVANYRTDRVLMKQRTLHEILDRLLWRFSMENEGDKINWDNDSKKYYIYYNTFEKLFTVEWNIKYKSSSNYFYTKEIAKAAIEEVIKPFMSEHPDFKW